MVESAPVKTLHKKPALPPKYGLGVWKGLVVLACQLPVAVCANNGLNLIGFGAASVGMGGADIAVSIDTSALNSNPAGIARLKSTAFEGYSTTAIPLDVAHADQFGNDNKVDNKVIAIGGFGFSTPLGATGLVAGIGFFGQGGAGNVYKHLVTPFGGRDELSALFAIARLTSGLAWRVSDQLSVGMSVAVTGARAKQSVFPNTSVFNAVAPAQSFFGTTIKELQSTRLGARVGVHYEPMPGFTLSSVYATKTALPLSTGYADVNLGAVGLGVVRYRDVSITGLGLPQEIGIGAAWQATPRTLASVAVKRLAWSGVLRSQSLVATNPDNPAAPAVIQQSSRLDWKDQYVFAIGLAHAMNEQVTLYGGFNYGRNPVPPRTTSPLLSASGEKHLTAGARVLLHDGWQLSGAIEYLMPKKVTYNNPELPFGPGAQERMEYAAVTIMLGKRW